jgi:acyl dehydratase
MSHSAIPDAGTVLPKVRITISQKMIDRYAAISGDFNPLHVDVDAAEKSPFGGTVAHGCIPMEPIFQALAKALGRPDLPYGTEISLRYRRPSTPGDTIHVEATMLGAAEGDRDHRRVEFACLNQHEEPVLDGNCRLPADGGAAGQ